MKSEKELFLEWHFLQWKLNNAVTDTVDFAKVLYDRVYSHDHTSSVRDVELKAWQASASREGYKLVPVEPTDIEIESIKERHWSMRGCQLCKSDYIDLYKAMIEAA